MDLTDRRVFGKMVTGNSRIWKKGRNKDITFIVTKDCQLACKYCYQVGKNSNERMSWETAKKAVDYILSHEYDDAFDFESVSFAFIGGEPFLEIDLIDKICDYLKMEMYLKGHHWFNSYRFSITTNGINYDSPKVQNFIRKNAKHLSLTITIDGTRQKHDMNRIWKKTSNDVPRGSYENVVRNIPLWIKQFPQAATKVTISSPDIPYICESVLHIFSLGIKSVYINCVYEDVWKEGDDSLFEEQLFKLAEAMVGKGLYQHCYCSFFQRGIGMPLSASHDYNWCGAGMMLAVDKSGMFYPCLRFAKYSLHDRDARVIGDVDNGLNENLLRPYYCLSRSLQSSTECFECEVASGCAWCQAENYDSSDSGTIFSRSTSLCKMHKARVRANNYYWSRIDEIEGIKQVADEIKVDNKCRLDKSIETPNTIVVILSSRSTAFCVSDNPHKEAYLIPISTLRNIVEKAHKENLKLEFVFPEQELTPEYMEVIDSIEHHKITPASSKSVGDAVVLNGWNELSVACLENAFCILRTTREEFYKSVMELEPLLKKAERLNLVFTDEDKFCKDDENPYREALSQLSLLVLHQWLNGHIINVNVITDRLQLSEMDNCNAGWKSITLAPNGKYYICPDFYYTHEEDSCGDIEKGIDIRNPLLYKLNHAPLCRDCGAYHCQRCVFLNKKKTLEVNIPSYEQCVKADIELSISKQFYELWKK